MRRFALHLLLAIFPATLMAQETPAEPPMTQERLGEIVTALDPDAATNGTMWQLTINDVTVLIISDKSADRMRTIAPVRAADEMTAEDLERVMQANFDTALDARYAIAKSRLWATYIHPLSPLSKNELISGIAQTVNLVESYGTLFTSGVVQFGTGDSGALQRELIDQLLKKGEEI